MHSKTLLGLVALASTAFAEYLPANHFLWGEKGPAGAGLVKRATTTTTATAATSRVADAACTNGPNTRNCWSGSYNVATDFDNKWPTTGKTASYNFEITNSTCNPDGNGPRRCMLINNQFPGPVIHANWGDYISVTVKNSMPDNGTSIHWHGIRQLGTNGMDGVNGLTECPLAPGDTKTYRFQATQFGTTWYHSHHSAQYGDGIVGTIIINGPASANYDEDLGVFPVTDWYYDGASTISDRATMNLGHGAPPPNADTILVNGTNKNPNGGGSYATVTMTKNKKYRVRLINTSVDNNIRVSLDGHPFQVITADLVPIKPYTTNWVLMAIGQRYDVIVTANQTPGNYWFRAEVANDCFSGNNYFGRAVFTYSGVAAGDPTSTGTAAPQACHDETPLVPWVVNNVPSGSFASQVKNLQVDLGMTGVTTNQQNVVLWGINMTAIDVMWEKPTLQYVADSNSNYPTAFNLIEIPTENIWTYWIVQVTAGTPVPAPHPIHLHGHDFYVLGQDVGQFNPDTDVAKLQFNNPIRRDTTFLPGGGWVAIAFPTDNPGDWLMHCHIAWHISEGLGVQFLEAKSSFKPLQSDFAGTCSKWSSYYSTAYWKKTDSGL